MITPQELDELELVESLYGKYGRGERLSSDDKKLLEKWDSFNISKFLLSSIREKDKRIEELEYAHDEWVKNATEVYERLTTSNVLLKQAKEYLYSFCLTKMLCACSEPENRCRAHKAIAALEAI